MPDDRDRELRAERGRQRKRQAALQRDTQAEIGRILRRAEESVAARLATGGSDFQRFALPKLQEELRRALVEMERDGAAAMTRGAERAWAIGVDQVDAPIEAGLEAGGTRISIGALVPSIDTRQLAAMRGFLTDRIQDISASLADRINEQLGLVMAGERTPSDAATAIREIFRSGGVNGGRARALTITRTELGRAYSIAGQQRLDQATSLLPGLRKQWRRSGKIRSRTAHDLADGQIKPVDEPFLVGGYRLRHPRDPRAPASETVNCGCASLPFMESWEVQQPGRQPFSAEEQRLDPRKRELAELYGDYAE